MITIRGQGTEELIRDLRKAAIDVQGKAREVLREQAEKSKYDAQERVPIGATMALLASIRHGVSRKKLTAWVSAGGKVGGNDTYYAYFVEFGTKKQTAQPFLFPAARAHDEETQRRLTEVMFAALRGRPI